MCLVKVQETKILTRNTRVYRMLFEQNGKYRNIFEWVANYWFDMEKNNLCENANKIILNGSGEAYNAGFHSYLSKSTALKSQQRWDKLFPTEPVTIVSFVVPKGTKVQYGIDGTCNVRIMVTPILTKMKVCK